METYLQKQQDEIQNKITKDQEMNDKLSIISASIHITHAIINLLNKLYVPSGNSSAAAVASDEGRGVYSEFYFQNQLQVSSLEQNVFEHCHV